MAAPVLSQRALNRALLERQRLLRRVDHSAGDTAQHLVGLQAQEPFDPYVGLWSRLEHFDPHELGGLLVDRAAVRAPLMRATIHLVTARDLRALRPLMQPVLERAFRTGSPFGRNLKGFDFDELLHMGRTLVESEPRTRAELRPLVHERWPDHDSESLVQAITYLVPVVQVPPRAVWGHSGQARWASARKWLGRELDTEPDLDALVRRYLAAFGPATPADMQNWSRLTGLRAVFERLRPELLTFADENERELFDVPGATLPDADTPAPVRFLPQYDNVTLGHQDRTRVAPPAARELTWSEGGWMAGILVDGFLRGTWRLERKGKGTATLVVRLGENVSARERAETVEEAGRLLAFLADDAPASTIDVR